MRSLSPFHSFLPVLLPLLLRLLPSFAWAQSSDSDSDSSDSGASCFLPNGTSLGDTSLQSEFYSPCPGSPATDGYHMCCKTSNNFRDVCNSNGLCARPNNPGLGELQGLVRTACTDPSWSSASCLQLCTTDLDYLGNERNATLQYVHQCPDGSFCCQASQNNTITEAVSQCCVENKGYFISSNGTVYTNVNPSASNPSASIPTTASSSPTTNSGVATPTSTSPSPTSTAMPTPKDSHTGGIAGGVVGGVVGAAVLAGIGSWLWRRRRRIRLQVQQSQEVFGGSRGYDGGAIAGQGGMVYRKKSELDGAEQTREKDGDERFEMDGVVDGAGREGGVGRGPFEKPVAGDER